MDRSLDKSVLSLRFELDLIDMVSDQTTTVTFTEHSKNHYLVPDTIINLMLPVASVQIQQLEHSNAPHSPKRTTAGRPQPHNNKAPLLISTVLRMVCSRMSTLLRVEPP